jgi:hypothetical protein
VKEAPRRCESRERRTRPHREPEHDGDTGCEAKHAYDLALLMGDDQRRREIGRDRCAADKDELPSPAQTGQWANENAVRSHALRCEGVTRIRTALLPRRHRVTCFPDVLSRG